MDARHLPPLAVWTSITIGAFAANALHAQAPPAAPRPAYYVSEFEVTDREGMRPYSERVASTFEPFGVRYIVRGGIIAPLEGEAAKGGIVVIAFDSMERAQAWYDSPAYRELRPIREGAAKSRTFIVEGTAN